MDLKELREWMERRFDKIEAMNERVVRNETATTHLTSFKSRAEKQLESHERFISMARGVGAALGIIAVLVAIGGGLVKLGVVHVGADGSPSKPRRGVPNGRSSLD